MDSSAQALAHSILAKLADLPPGQRLLVGISGIPASGKSTFAEMLVKHLNAAQQYETAILVGLDGWHLTRAQLDKFDDPKLAHDRRGTHWTFDGNAYVDFVKSLRSSKESISAPSFDHAVKDPVVDSVHILSSHRIVVIEGLYTFLSIPPWNVAGEMLDERVYLQIGIEEATERLVKRHVLTGVAKDMPEAIWRAEENDMPNGRLIMSNMIAPTHVIDSIEDPVLSGTSAPKS